MSKPRQKCVGWPASEEQMKMLIAGKCELLSRREDFSLSDYGVGSLSELFEIMPYGRVGDLIYIQEEWKPLTDCNIQYKFDNAIRKLDPQRQMMVMAHSKKTLEIMAMKKREIDADHPWMDAMFMPFWASRLLFRVTQGSMTEATDKSAVFTIWITPIDIRLPEYRLPDPLNPSRIEVELPRGVKP